jgi:hypothetical protein
MNPREQWIMGAIAAVAALYFFELRALYLFAIAGVIFFILRNRT